MCICGRRREKEIDPRILLLFTKAKCENISHEIEELLTSRRYIFMYKAVIRIRALVDNLHKIEGEIGVGCLNSMYVCLPNMHLDVSLVMVGQGTVGE